MRKRNVIELTKHKKKTFPKVRYVCGEVQRIRGPNALPERWVVEKQKWQVA